MDVADLTLLAEAIPGDDPRFDVNQDGAVSSIDYTFWVTDLKGTVIGWGENEKTRKKEFRLIDRFTIKKR